MKNLKIELFVEKLDLNNFDEILSEKNFNLLFFRLRIFKLKDETGFEYTLLKLFK